MADDWADTSNLWWLKPRNPGGQSSLPAFQLGAQIQQQRIQNDIETKKMALDHQYRMDHLRTQDRVATAQIERYAEIAKERKDEEDDLQAMQPAINDIAQGKTPVVPRFRSYRGAMAWSDIYTAITRQNAQKAGTAAQKQNNLTYDNMAASIIANAKVDGKPDPDAVMASELAAANRDGWDFQSAARIMELDRKWNPGPTGMVPGRVTVKGPLGTTTFVRPPEAKIPTIAAELQSARDLEEQAGLAETEEEANRLREDAKAIRSHVSPFARLPRADQDVIDNYITREVNRINKANEGISPKDKNYQTKTRDTLLAEGAAYLQGLKEKSGAPTVSAPKRVRVIAPDGRAGTLPESQLEEALKAGYKRVE